MKLKRTPFEDAAKLLFIQRNGGYRAYYACFALANSSECDVRYNKLLVDYFKPTGLSSLEDSRTGWFGNPTPERRLQRSLMLLLAAELTEEDL